METCADFLYEIVDGEITITKYIGEHETLVIPEEIEGYPVRVIGPESFAENGGELNVVTIPSSVREIGDGAFKFCLGLMELHIKEGLQVLGTDVVLVTPISELYLPSTVHTIKKPHELGGLKLNISPENPYYYSDGYGLYQKHPLGDILLAVDLRGERKSYQIPEGTRVIGQGALCGEETIEEVWCPSTLRVIEEEAFESCRRLRKIHFNSALESIGTNAFSYCALSGDLIMPEALCNLGETVFTNTFDWDQYEDGLRAIVIAKDNPRFVSDEDGFYRVLCDGTWELVRYFGDKQTWRIPDCVSRIGAHAFRRAKVREVTIPNTVKQIGERAFFENPNILALWLEQDETKIYIPRTPVYRKDEITGLLKKEQACYRYDYQKYDCLWSTYLYIEDQAGMASFRLKYPLELSKDQEQFYRTWLTEHLVEVMEDVSAREDLERLAELSEIGYFTNDTIDDAIEVLNRTQKTELLGFLMEYKERALIVEEFDFSL